MHARINILNVQQGHFWNSPIIRVMRLIARRFRMDWVRAINNRNQVASILITFSESPKNYSKVMWRGELTIIGELEQAVDFHLRPKVVFTFFLLIAFFLSFRFHLHRPLQSFFYVSQSICQFLRGRSPFMLSAYMSEL